MNEAGTPRVARGYLLVTMATGLHACVPVVGAFVMGTLGMAPIAFSVVHMTFAALMGFAFLAVFPGPGELRAQLKANWRPLALMGLILSAGVWTYFIGLALVEDPTISSFFGRFATVFSILLGVLVLKERLSPVEALGILIAISGSLVISYEGGRVVFAGMVLIMVSGLCFSFETMIGKMRLGRIDPVLLVAAPAAVSVLVLAPVGILTGDLNLEIPLEALRVIALSAFVGDILGFATHYRSMRYIGFAVASAMRSTHPLFVAAVSVATIGVLPDAWGWFGGVVIIAGVLMMIYGGARRNSAGKPTKAVGADAPGEGSGGS